MTQPRIVLLLRDNRSSRILFHALRKHFEIEKVLLESASSHFEQLSTRIRRHGIFRTLGQLLFRVALEPLLRIEASSRQSQLLKDHHLCTEDIPECLISRIPSVNSEICQQSLTNLNPNIVIINGVSIVGKKTLEALKCPVLNIHAGITPAYRGVHGGYWALVQNDPDRFGVTLHTVDSGVDTGAVIAQQTLRTTEKDNYVTYPLLQLAHGIELLKEALSQLRSIGRFSTLFPEGTSEQWYHPTAWEYVKNRLLKRVK